MVVFPIKDNVLTTAVMRIVTGSARVTTMFSADDAEAHCDWMSEIGGFCELEECPEANPIAMVELVYGYLSL